MRACERPLGLRARRSRQLMLAILAILIVPLLNLPIGTIVSFCPSGFGIATPVLASATALLFLTFPLAIANRFLSPPTALLTFPFVPIVLLCAHHTLVALVAIHIHFGGLFLCASAVVVLAVPAFRFWAAFVTSRHTILGRPYTRLVNIRALDLEFFGHGIQGVWCSLGFIARQYRCACGRAEKGSDACPCRRGRQGCVDVSAHCCVVYLCGRHAHCLLLVSLHVCVLHLFWWIQPANFGQICTYFRSCPLRFTSVGWHCTVRLRRHWHSVVTCPRYILSAAMAPHCVSLSC